TADGRGRRERRAARRLPGDVRPRLPFVDLGARPRRWAQPGAKEAFALLARESVAVPGPAADRLAAAARDNGVWLVTGVNEVDPERPATIYNTLLYHAPDGSLALKHRKLVPTNHERLVWGQGDGGGLR